MEQLLILPGCIFLLVFAIFLGASLRLKSRIVYLLSLFLLAYTSIVIISWLASLLDQITPGFYLLIHALLALCAIIAWWSVGRPPLAGPFQGWHTWRKIPFRSYPEITILGLGVFLVYLAGGLLILLTPPNNYDSMTYHLSRIGYWLQHNNLYPWITPNPRQTSFPPNAELGVLWTVLFWGNDQLSGLIQWFSVPVGMAAIYGLAALNGARRWQAIALALLWATLPEIFLQSITTMNDLLAAAFLASAIYLLYLGWKINDRLVLLLSGIGLGLAFGVKLTVIFALPGIFLAALLLFVLRPENHWRKAALWVLSSGLSILILGALILAQNWQFYRDPFSVPQWTTSVARPQYNRVDLLAKNLFIFTTQTFDLTGLPEGIQQPFGKIKSLATLKIAKGLSSLRSDLALSLPHQLKRALIFPRPVQEDTAWFGFLFPLLFFPALIIEVLNGIRKRDHIRLGLSIIVITFTLILSAAQDWTLYRGRYFVLVSPLAAVLLIPWYRDYRGSIVVRWAITVFSLFILVWTILFNQSKPLAGPNSIWSSDRIAIQTRNNPGMQPVLRAIEGHVPADAILGTKMSEDAWDYPLFGKNFKREVIQLDPFSEKIDYAQLSQNGIDYLLVEPREQTGLQSPEGLELVWENDGWRLFKVCQVGQCEPKNEQDSRYLGLEDPLKLVKVSPSLAGEVGILELDAAEWPVEQVNGQGLYWLGESYFQGLKGYIWSDEERDITISVQVEPGPSNPNPLRNLVFSLNWLIGYQRLPQGFQTKTVPFDEPQTVDFRVKLQPGLNQFHLYSNDLASISQLDNGDRRPLLILIKDIFIQP